MSLGSCVFGPSRTDTSSGSGHPPTVSRPRWLSRACGTTPRCLRWRSPMSRSAPPPTPRRRFRAWAAAAVGSALVLTLTSVPFDSPAAVASTGGSMVTSPVRATLSPLSADGTTSGQLSGKVKLPTLLGDFGDYRLVGIEAPEGDATGNALRNHVYPAGPVDGVMTDPDDGHVSSKPGRGIDIGDSSDEIVRTPSGLTGTTELNAVVVDIAQLNNKVGAVLGRSEIARADRVRTVATAPVTGSAEIRTAAEGLSVLGETIPLTDGRLPEPVTKTQTVRSNDVIALLRSLGIKEEDIGQYAGLVSSSSLDGLFSVTASTPAAGGLRIVASLKLRIKASLIVGLGAADLSADNVVLDAVFARTSADRPTVIAPSGSRLKAVEAEPGEQVSISGTGYVVGGTTVTVGGSPAEVETVATDGKELTFTVPLGLSLGTYPVRVSTPGGQDNAGDLRVAADEVVPLTVTGVSPTTAPDGATVTVKGSGFVPTRTSVVVTDAAGAAQVVPATRVDVAESGISLTFPLPEGIAVGTAGLSVRVADRAATGQVTVVPLTLSPVPSTGTASVIGIAEEQTAVPLSVDNSGTMTWTPPTLINPAGSTGSSRHLTVGLPDLDTTGAGRRHATEGPYAGEVVRTPGRLTATASTGAFGLDLPAPWSTFFATGPVVTAGGITVSSSADTTGTASNSVQINDLKVLGNQIALNNGRLDTAQEFTITLNRDQLKARSAMNGVFFSAPGKAYDEIKADTFATLWVRVEPVAPTADSGAAGTAAFRVVADLQYRYVGENGGLLKTRARHGSGANRDGLRVTFFSAEIARTSATSPAAVEPGLIRASPNATEAGAMVTLTGRGFTADSVVRFGAVEVPAATVSENGTELTFVVPTAAGGPHQVTVRNSAGSSNSRVVTVATAPSITRQPASVTVSAGRPATFEVAGDGDPAPLVQWERKDAEGWRPVAGATGSSYTVNATAADNDARFRAVLSNALGSVTSEVATLTVDSLPEFTRQPADATLTEGDPAARVVAVRSNPAATISWQINRGAGWTVIPDQTTDTLTYVVGPEDHQAKVRAEARNSVGSVFSDAALLTVRYAPRITAAPVDATVQEGSTASFTARANGNPVPHVLWQFRLEVGGAWQEFDAGQTPSALDHTLTLPATAALDGRYYRAIFTNGVGGEVATEPAQLTVVPVVVVQPGELSALASPLKAGITALEATGKANGGALSGLINAELAKGVELGKSGVFMLPELGTPQEKETLEKVHPAAAAAGSEIGDMGAGTRYGDTTVRNIWDAEGMHSSVLVESFHLDHLAVDKKGRIGALLGISDLVEATAIRSNSFAPSDDDHATAVSGTIGSLKLLGQEIGVDDGLVSGRLAAPVVRTLQQTFTDIPSVLANAGIDISSYFTQPLIGVATVKVTVTASQPRELLTDTAAGTGLKVTAKAAIDINLSTQGSDVALVETVNLTTDGEDDLFEVLLANTAAARNGATLPEPGEGTGQPENPEGPEEPALPTLPVDHYRPTSTPDRVVLLVTEDPSDSRNVTWRTDESVTSAVAEIRPAAGGPTVTVPATTRAALDREAEQNGQTASYRARTHTVDFAGLTPGTKYTYRVGNGLAGAAGAWSTWHTFSTTGNKNEPFGFIYLGDAQNEIRQKWAAAVNEAYTTLPDAKLVLHAGDLINHADNDVEWGEWFGAAPDRIASVDQFAVPGNHEFISGGLYDSWDEHFTYPKNGPKPDPTVDACTLVYQKKIAASLANAVYFSDFQGVRFISLSGTIGTRDMIPASEDLAAANCDGTKDMVAIWLKLQSSWLDKVLTENKGQWSVVSFHQPLFSTSVGRDNEHLRQAFLDIIEKHNVDLVLQGHDHTYGRGHMVKNEVAGKTGLQTGPVYAVSVLGPKAYDLDNSVNNDWTENGARRVVAYQKRRSFQDISIDRGHLTYKAIEYRTGQVIDSLQICKAADGSKLVAEAGATLPAECPGVTAPADTVAPRLTVVADPVEPASTWYGGAVAVSASAVDDVDANPVVEVSIDGAAWGTYAAAVRLTADGTHTVKFRAKDAAGNVSADVVRTVRIDGQAPVTAPEITGAATVSVKLTATDALSGVSRIDYRVGEGDWTRYQNPFTFPRGPLATVISYRATDVAGNVETTRTVAVPGETAPERVASITAVSVLNPTVVVGQDVRVKVTVTAPAVIGTESVAVHVDGKLFASVTLPSVAGFTHSADLTLKSVPAGSHEITARYAGNGAVLGSVSVPAGVSVRFADYSDRSAFFTEVMWLAGTGITTGQTPTTFAPALPVSRQAMAAFLYRLEHPGAAAPVCTRAPFTDVPVTETFCGEISWLASSGITTGENGKFQRVQPVSRQAMAAFLYRLVNGAGKAPACTVKPFGDVGIKDPFCGEISWLAKQKITTGADGKFSPNGAVSREAMAAFLYRLKGIGK
ncbi:hypothetical protein D1871_00430 [Nakamurella silvestris]|nr:hypothetical protein D1871_00430 [Nakamurella silvestris]